MQAEHLDLDRIVDQGRHPAGELALVGDVGKQHADGERGCSGASCPEPRATHARLHHQPSAQPKHSQVLHTKHKGVGHAKADVHLGGAHIAVLHLHQQVLPAGTTLLLAAKEFERGDGPQGFQEVGVFSSGDDQALGSRFTKRAVGHPAHQAIQGSGCHRDCGQLGRIQQHHAQRGQAHDAVQHRLHHAGGQRALNSTHRPKAADDIAQVAFLKELDW